MAKEKTSAPYERDTSRSPPLHFLTAHLGVLGAVWDSVRADKAPSLNPISCESERCCLSRWPDVWWSAQQQGAADVLYSTSCSWRNRTAFWGILGIFPWWGANPYVSYQAESCPFSCKSVCEWSTLLLLYVCCYLCMVKGFWCEAVKSKNSARSLPDKRARRGTGVERRVGNPRRGRLEHSLGWGESIISALQMSFHSEASLR